MSKQTQERLVKLGLATEDEAKELEALGVLLPADFAKVKKSDLDKVVGKNKAALLQAKFSAKE